MVKIRFLAQLPVDHLSHLVMSSFILNLLILISYSFVSFSHQYQLMVFHWSWNDVKFPQVSRTILSILADLNNALIKMVSIRVLIYNSSSPFTNPLVTEPSAPSKVSVLISFSSSFNFTLSSAGTAKSTIRQVCFFKFFLLPRGLVVWPGLGDPFVY